MKDLRTRMGYTTVSIFVYLAMWYVMLRVGPSTGDIWWQIERWLARVTVQSPEGRGTCLLSVIRRLSSGLRQTCSRRTVCALDHSWMCVASHLTHHQMLGA